MTTSDRADGLRAQADALDAEAGLEEALAKAKKAHADKGTDKTKAAKHEAAEALRAHRQETRENAATAVGGDAFPSEGSEN